MGRPPDQHDSANKETAVGEAINNLLAEAFAEVDDQGIPCGDAATRALAPLEFIQRCLCKTVYTRKSASAGLGFLLTDPKRFPAYEAETRNLP